MLMRMLSISRYARLPRLAVMIVLWIVCCICRAQGAEWIQAGSHTNKPIWGLREGLQFAIHPGGFGSPTGGPRGLIRIGYPVLPEGAYDLINFIAVEPVVKGEKGFSELERSKLDDAQGKRFWSGDENEVSALNPGRLSVLPDGTEQLEVTLRVEKFDNGARVFLVITQRSDQPGEIELAMHAEKDSAPMEYCILTATMGNKARARCLWLKDEIVSSLEIFGDYTGNGFAPHAFYPLRKLHRSREGDVLSAITTNEAEPAAVRPFPGSRAWYYGGFPVTQYWRKPRGRFRDDLHVAVNGRYTYWQSNRPIPGGVSFENFEMRERFYNGQRFVFGITSRSPRELGFPAATPSEAERSPGRAPSRRSKRSSR